VDELFTKIIDKVSIEMCLLFQFDFLSMIHWVYSCFGVEFVLIFR
jgi:hypothetical protein